MKWTAVVSWILIVGTCVFVPVMRARVARHVLSEAPSNEIDIQTRLMGRYVVGASRVFPTQGQSLTTVFANQPHAGETQEIAAAIVAGEVDGRDAAIKRLKQIDTPVAREFEHVYEPDSSAVDLSKQRDRFGWFVDLAQSFGRPDTDALRARVLKEARRTFLTAIVAIVIVCGAGAIGLGLFVTAIVLFAIGKMRFSVHRPGGSSAVYIEAFTIYIIGILSAGIAISLVFPKAPLWTHILAMLGIVILAFLWPGIRGVTWSDQKRDWGIHAGSGFFIEALCGIGGYLAGLPVIAVGILITFFLITKSGTTATHPIVQDLDMSPFLLLGIASVFAPLTEELMFRGALVSHLRAGMGVVLSAVLSGVIFASIHPQGWAAIPALASIGMVLAVIRQWRGSLVPSMIAHALHNGVLLTTVIIMVR